MKSVTVASRAFGIVFIIGYLSYGFGFGHLNTLLDSPEGLHTIANSKSLVIFEASVLMAVFAISNIVLAAIITPILKPYQPTLALGFLGAAISSTILLIVGSILLLVTVPLSEEYVLAKGTDSRLYELLFLLLKNGNFYSYQIAMVVWGMGGLVLSSLLYISKLVPTWLSIWGIIGYIIFISGAFFALFGVSIDIYLDIPGGLFEIFLSFWMIMKGLNVSSQSKLLSKNGELTEHIV